MATNALTAADSVLIPVKPGHFALDAVDKLFKYLDWIREVANKTISVEGILLTMHEPNTRVTDITLRELHAKYHKHLFEIFVPKNNLLGEASFYGKPAVLYDINSRGSKAYLELAQQVIARTTGVGTTAMTSQPNVVQKYAQQA
jgi:chromosome partitioning protein